MGRALFCWIINWQSRRIATCSKMYFIPWRCRNVTTVSQCRVCWHQVRLRVAYHEWSCRNYCGRCISKMDGNLWLGMSRLRLDVVKTYQSSRVLHALSDLFVCFFYTVLQLKYISQTIKFQNVLPHLLTSYQQSTCRVPLYFFRTSTRCGFPIQSFKVLQWPLRFSCKKDMTKVVWPS